MNTVYRLVWNASLGIWVAVSELAKARGKGKSGLRRARRALPVALLSVTLVGVPGTADAWMVTTATTGANSSAADRGIASNTVVGNGAKATGLITANGENSGTGEATAVGNAAEASGYRAVSIGAGSKATQEKSTAIGFGTQATQAFTFAAGTQASASGYASTSVGSSSKASGTAATALGQETIAEGAYSTALGQKSAITANRLTKATGLGSVAVGSGTIASGENSIAVGSEADAAAMAGIAIGLKAQVKKGTSEEAPGHYSSAIGNEASTFGKSSLAFGYQATANADVVGVTGLTASDVESTNSIAIGAQSRSATRSVAVGTLASAATDYSIAMGNNAKTIYEKSIAIGRNSEAGHIADDEYVLSGGESVALGDEAKATGIESTAVGAQAKATRTGSVAVGKGVEATGYQAVAIGGSTGETTTSAQGNGSVALGAGATSISSNSVAIGIFATTGAIPDPKTGVVVGNSAVAIGQHAESIGQTSVAIGGVSAKATGHESVALGSYVEATAEGATALGQAVIQTADGQRLTTTSTGGVRTATAASGKYSVAVGSGVTAQAQDSIAMGTLAAASSAAIGGIAIGFESQVKAVNATAIGTEAEALGVSAFAAGAGAKAEGTSSTAVGTSSYAKGASSTALGANSATAEAAPTTLVMVNDTEQTGIAGTAAAGTVSVGSDSQKRTITNVAAGRVSNDSTDAINGSQLQAVIDTPMLFAGNGEGTIKKKLGEDAPVSIVGLGDADGTYTGHNLKTEVVGGELQIQMTDSPDFTTVNVGKDKTTVLTGDGLTIENGPSVLADGISAGGFVISDVAKGDISENSTEAINGSQLFTTNNDLKALKESPLTFVDSLGNEAKRTLGQSMSILGGGATGNGETYSAGNVLTELDADGNLVVKLAEDATFTSVTTGNAKLDNNGLTIENGPSVLADGISAGGFVISDVAKGDISENSTEAINGSQLFTTNNDLKALKESPLTFVDSLGNEAKRTLGQSMSILGGGATGNGETYSVGNVLTELDADGNLVVKLAEDATFTSVTTGNAKLDNNGLTIENGPSVLADGISAGGFVISDVAKGDISENSTEAINGSQLFTTNNDLKALKESPLTFVDSLGNEAKRTLGQSMSILGGGATGNGETYSAGNVLTELDADGNLVVKLAEDATFTSVTTGNAKLDNNGLTIENGPSVLADGISAGGFVISDVAKGDISENSTEAINGSQLFTTNNDLKALKESPLTFVDSLGNEAKRTLGQSMSILGGGATGNGETYSAGNVLTELDADGNLVVKLAEDATFTSVTTGNAKLDNNGLTIENGPSVLADGISAGGFVISDVAKGDISENSTEAINGSQLFTTNNDLKALKESPLTFVDSLGNEAKRTLGQSMSILGGGATGNGETYSAGNVLTELDADGNLVVKLAEDATFTSVTTGNAKLDNNGLTIENGPSVLADGISAGGFVISDVAKGDISENSTEAINGSQLFTTNNDLKALKESPLTFVDSQGNEAKRTLGQSMSILGGGATGNGETYSAGNVLTELDADGNLVVKLAEDATFTSVTTGNAKLDNNGLTIENGPSVLADGISAGGFVISDVAKGDISENSTEAINGSQLFTTNNDLKALKESPLTFVDSLGNEAKRTLGQSMSILGGGATGNGEIYSAGNVLTELDADGNLVVKLAEDATFTSVTTGNAKLDNNGLTIENGPSVLADGISAGGFVISDVAKGDISENSTEAINGSQLFTTNNDLKALKESPLTFVDSQGNEAKRTLGQSMSILGGGATGNGETYSAGNVLTELDADGNLVVKLAEDATFTSVTTGNAKLDNNGLTIENGPSVLADGISAGGFVISDVAKGDISENSTEAINGSQLFTTNNDLKALKESPLTFVDSLGNEAKRTLGQSMSILGGGTTGNGETYSAGNVLTELDADGNLVVKLAEDATFTSVTTGNAKLDNNGLTITDGPKFTKGEIDVANNTIGNVADGVDAKDAVNVSQLNNKVKYFKANSEGTEAHAAGLDSVAIGMGAIAHNINDVALGANSVTAKAKGQNDVEINGETYEFAGKNATSTVSVGDVGSERTISNVAAGELSKTSTDAVNGSQLFATNSAVEDLNTSVGELTDSPLTFAANQGDDVKRKLGQTMRILGGGATENGETYSAGNVLTELDDKGDLTIKLADNATFESLTTGNTVMNNDGLTIKDGPKFTKDEIDVANNTIVNVAAGVDDTDAVNVGQLNNKVKYFKANSEGAEAHAAGLDSVAIGMGAVANNANDVALGAGSVSGDVKGQASVEINGKPYDFAGVNATSTVSVGDVGSERTISNVAAGELSKTSTDAVNGSQLFATNSAVEDLNTSVGELTDSPLTFAANQGDNAKRKLGDTMRILGGGATENGETYSAGNVLTALDDKGDLTIKLADNATFESLTTGNTVMNNDGLTIKDGPKFTKGEIDVANNTIGNVADGVKDSDAVNLSQLKAGTKYFNANSKGDDSDAAGLDSVAIGMSAIAHNANDVALGAGSVTGDVKGQASVEINGETYAFAGANPTSTVSVGDVGSERTISNVAAGELSKTSTDAVNGSQLFATNTALENLDNSVGGLQDDALLWDKSKGAFSASHGDTTVNKITNVAAGELGEKSTDAVNGSQLYTTNQKVETNTTNIAKNTQNISNLGDSVENIYNTGTKYFHANSTGADSQALGDDSVAIGMGAIAHNANDVALGAGSVTGDVKGQASVEINGETYAFAGANPTSTVSVGSEGQERTISNVAAGELSKTSTDVVNGSQLFATNTALENLDNSVGGLQNDALLWDKSKGAFSASHGDTTVNKITNVAAGELGEKSTDAVNGSQLYTTNQNVEANTTNIAKNRQNISNLGDTVENIYNTGTKYFHANSTGADSDAAGLDSVAIGMGAVANNANDVALGAGSVSGDVKGQASVEINGETYAFAGANATSTVSVGDVGSERTISNVAAGELSKTSTDAVNGSQLFATNTALENLDNSVGGLQNDALLWDADKGAFSASHGDTTVNKITNVDAGELSAKSTDAVNGSQLFATNQQVETNTTNISNLGDSVENIYNTGIKYFHANSTGADSQALGQDSVAIGMGAIANNANDVALGANSVTDAAVGTAGVSINGTDYAFAGANPTSTVSVGDVGRERTITNVAAGRLSETSTDAVNGSQLFATNTALENLDNSVGGLQNDALLWDADKGAFSASHGDTTVNKITNVDAGELSAKSTDAVNGSQLFATNQQVETNTTNISNLGDTVENIYNTGIKYFHANSTGADSQALGQDSVAIGMGAIANNANDVALGANSVTDAVVGTAGVTLRGTDYAFAGANPTSTVSVGDVGSERTITNVAAGRLSETSTDAVNGSQLYATNSAVENLHTSVGGLEQDALQWDEDKGAFSASHGNTTVNKITNVAAGELGEKSTDAVNGSQLFATNQQVETNTTNISNLGDSVENIYTTGTKYFHANSTGADSQALGLDSVAIGMGAVANNAGDIALGAGSLTEAAVGTAGVTLRGTDYAFAGANPTSTVSVGSEGAERTITNVAAGRLSETSTDAVNGSQLYATNTAMENLNIDVDGLQKDALLWDEYVGSFSASHGDTAVNKITNVAAGELSEQSTDAVNGSQLFATNQQVATNTTNIAQNTQNISNLGDTVENIYNTGIKYFHANSTGADSQALGLDSVAIGMGAVANNAGDIALGAGSLTEAAVGTAGVTLRGTDYAFAGANPTSTLSVGSEGNERTITHVAAGRLSSTSTDAVNGSQLFATNTALENIVVNVDDLKGDALLWDENLGAFSASHGSTTVNKITNVAAGELSDKSTDAVNGSQLYATNKKVDNLDYRVTNIEENYTNTVLPTMRYLKVNSTGPDAVASGKDAVALGQGTVASGDNSIATGNGAQASGNGAIATGNNASASGTGSVAIGDNASVTASNSVALGSGSVADRDNTVSVGSAGNERQVTNVAAGTEDTDAVNVGQLKDATGNITNNVTNISDGKDGMFQVNNTSNYAKPTVTGSDSLAGGAGSSASGSNSMAVGTKSSASGENSVALGNGSSATAKNSVALGTNSVANRENSVSMGYSGGERQVTNVAAGTETTDAVNVGQLKQGVSESVNYTNKQFNQLKNMVNDQKDKLSAGIAGAMAMSSLPQPYAPGASMVGLGGGTYQGQSAVAFGVSTISDNGKWVTKVSGTTNSQGDFGASIGVGYQW